MTTIRHACVAGTFYPADPAHLRAEIDACFAQRAPANAPGLAGERIKALIVPHAGYVYSGPVAASAYASLQPQADEIRRVVLLGPAHRMPFQGLALSAADAWQTPLGSVPVARSACEQLLVFPQVERLDAAFDGEHSLEVQLPFLQRLLGDFELIPLLVGAASAAEVAEVLESLWGGDETLILISSDLSHFLDDTSARALDAQTAAAILRLEPELIGPEQACGRYPMGGLLRIARMRGLKPEQLDLRNSSQTAGSPDRVVGYGAYAFH
ncbi:AmmeMemoRadiSam system protein B [Thiorhodovibrio frisius]|uniref:MEMO1 family protein Thi970DRAFT_03249 n=1 Tax=Thiorhodovibrio frisius TaxID=631362 RepID=H8Z6G1_9GAMM|nr:AmmeMemoRadiSam system protein B [Thiorhodovibrio frisius]EIC19659.1 putative dioxygenase [Thiorhodovibrio frisius]WPL20373.1 Memo-like protein [Thiorhodovibrio frisius]